MYQSTHPLTEGSMNLVRVKVSNLCCDFVVWYGFVIQQVASLQLWK